MLQIANVGQQNDTVEHRDAEQGNESHAAEMLKGIPRTNKANRPPVAARGMFRKISNAGLSGAEAEVEQNENQSQAKRERRSPDAG